MYDNFINCLKCATSKENVAAIFEDLKSVSRVSFIGSLAYLFFSDDFTTGKFYTAIFFAFNMVYWTSVVTCIADNEGGSK